MQYAEGERDMVMLQHKFEVETKEGKDVCVLIKRFMIGTFFFFDRYLFNICELIKFSFPMLFRKLGLQLCWNTVNLQDHQQWLPQLVRLAELRPNWF